MFAYLLKLNMYNIITVYKLDLKFLWIKLHWNLKFNMYSSKWNNMHSMWKMSKLFIKHETDEFTLEILQYVLKYRKIINFYIATKRYLILFKWYYHYYYGIMKMNKMENQFDQLTECEFESQTVFFRFSSIIRLPDPSS